MSSLISYEQNLQARLSELRRGDRAYNLHCDAILDTMLYESTNIAHANIQRVLDVGCGLGFLAARLSMFPDAQVIGIDPSAKAIELAKREHAGIPKLDFHTASAQEFSSRMSRVNDQLFHKAVLNMVLHSVDDEESSEILESIKDCLVAHGSLSLVIPDERWLVQKLVEQAQDADMNRKEGLEWIAEELHKDSVDLAVGIHGQKRYDHSIIVYNRTLEDYGSLLEEAGYGLDIRMINQQAPGDVQVIATAFWEFNDHITGVDLAARDRHILFTHVR